MDAHDWFNLIVIAIGALGIIWFCIHSLIRPLGDEDYEKEVEKQNRRELLHELYERLQIKKETGYTFNQFADMVHSGVWEGVEIGCE
jgi:hypothetical protein